MARTPIIVGNWKLNKTIDEAVALAQSVAAGDIGKNTVEVGIAPVYTALHSVSQVLQDTPIILCGQNCHYQETGAFTGEISPSFLKDAGAQMVIIGHSERRHVFDESDEVIGKKMRAALDQNIRTILCIGEKDEQRKSGQTNDVIAEQLKTGLAHCNEKDVAQIVIAYEPVWAIGTGNTATPALAQEVHSFIRDWVKEKFEKQAEDIQIQYGGSVKPANAAELLAQPDIDGALVGGASLTAEHFREIIKSA